MTLRLWICSLVVVSGGCQAFPFLWPSSFGIGSHGHTTTTTTITSHGGNGPPHPHAHTHAGVSSTSPVIGQHHHPLSSHLHVRPGISSTAYLNRPLPLPPLVGAHHYHRPVTSSGGSHQLHLHGGAIAGGTTPHRHYHIHGGGHHHHHHPHSSSRAIHSHGLQHSPPVLHYPILA